MVAESAGAQPDPFQVCWYELTEFHTVPVGGFVAQWNVLAFAAHVGKDHCPFQV